VTTTAQAFEQLLEDITPTPYQRSTHVPARQRRVEENLTASFPSNSDMPFLQTHLMGSAAKNTALRPLDDIDLLAEFNGVSGKAWLRYQYDSRRFLYRVRDAYNGLEARPVGARGQAVRVFFQQGGYVDVAPVFRWSNDIFVLPDGSGGWLRTSPPPPSVGSRRGMESSATSRRPSYACSSSGTSRTASGCAPTTLKL
jgi:Second Messenger Oligonucleotide or Dinucleotide Synthetase domain